MLPSLKDLHRTSFQLYKKSWAFLALIALVMTTDALVNSILPDDVSTLSIAQWGLTVLSFFLNIWAALTLLSVVITLADGKTRPSFGAAYNSTLPRLTNFLYTQVVLILLVGLGMLLIIPGIYGAVTGFATSFIFLKEGETGWNAFKRSHQLVKPYFWPILGRILALAGSIIIAWFGLLLVISLLATPWITTANKELYLQVVAYIVNIVMTTIVVPYSIFYTYNLYRSLLSAKSSV